MESGHNQSQTKSKLASGETGINLVPEFHIILVFFPAQENLRPPMSAGKSTRPRCRSLIKNFPVLEFLKQLSDYRVYLDGLIDQFAAGVLSRGH